jgi:hypothetical protein
MAIVVGLAALYMSWDQGRVMREEIAASVWPALQLDGFVTRDGEHLLLGMRIQNAGVGPALVQGMTLHHDGMPLADLAAVAAAMPAGAEERAVQLVSGRILAAGDRVEPFVFELTGNQGADAIELMTALGERWEATVCYCSSLGDCWQAGLAGAMPMAVEHCPATSGQF